MRNGKLLALDLFCGAGGFSEGMHLAGWETVLAIECDKAAAETYRCNHGASTHLLERRIEDVGFSTIKKALDQQDVSPDQIDLVIGGPPCQGFSTIGPRRLDDRRNGLFVEFMRVVELVKPRAFAAENVKGILSFAGGVMPHFLDAIAHKMGYRLSFITVNAAHYGVPQQRERVIFLGLRGDEVDRLGIERLDAPKPTAKRVSVWDAISDLPKGPATPSPRAYRVDRQTTGGALGDPMDYPSAETLTPYQIEMRLNSALLTAHHTKGMSPQRYERVCSMAEGSTLPSKGRANSWRRLNSNAYSHTLQAHMGKDLKEFIHPTENRWITVREAARLQSFCDRYVIEGAQSSQLRQIGNAVPPLVAKAFGQAIARQLTGKGEIELVSSTSLGHTRKLAAGKPNLGMCSVTDSARVLFSTLVATDPRLRLHVIHEWLDGER